MYTEQRLLHSLKAREIDAYRFLYDIYGSAIWGLILKKPDNICPEILFKNVFLEIFHHIESYNPDQGRLFTWIYQLTQKEMAKVLPGQQVMPPKSSPGNGFNLFCENSDLRFC